MGVICTDRKHLSQIFFMYSILLVIRFVLVKQNNIERENKIFCIIGNSEKNLLKSN